MLVMVEQRCKQAGHKLLFQSDCGVYSWHKLAIETVCWSDMLNLRATGVIVSIIAYIVIVRHLLKSASVCV